jgi:hypothetical protein
MEKRKGTVCELRTWVEQNLTLEHGRVGTKRGKTTKQLLLLCLTRHGECPARQASCSVARDAASATISFNSHESHMPDTNSGVVHELR